MDLNMEYLPPQGPDVSIAKKLQQSEDTLGGQLGYSYSNDGSSGSVDPLKSSTSESINNINSSNSDMSYHDNDEDVDDVYDDDGSDIDYYDDDDDYMYEEDEYSKMQAQFDNVDLPPGVEVVLACFNDPTPSENKSSITHKPLSVDLAESKMNTFGESSSSVPAATASSSSLPPQLPSDVKVEDGEEGVTKKPGTFKSFDTVEDFSDHHYSRMGFSNEQPPKNWAKRIQEEWKILEKNLPDTIFVMVYESRMELLRAVIIGPQGTPYHDGLFVFDCLFPTNYPNSPPMVYYYSGGLRLNPNLYECGKVCLSLLGTWSGQKDEMWIAGKSTMLQVLVSIQALILNAEPFYNEPGYETSYTGAAGKSKSNKYSEDAFIMSLKTMIYTLRRPPKHFEEFCAGHFRERAHDILEVCKAYTEGARVGSVIKGRAQENNAGDERCTSEFRAAVGRMMNMLVTGFTRNGSADCEKFRRAVT